MPKAVQHRDYNPLGTNAMYSVKANNGQLYGPVDLNGIRHWIGEGRVLPDTVLVDHSTNTEGPAFHFPLIAIYFQPAAKPSNPGPYGAPPGPYAASPGGMANSYAMPPQPYYGAPPRQMLVAGLLALFLGTLGIHQFYMGKTALGVIMLLMTVLGFLTCGITTVAAAIWALVDVILIFTNTTRDAEGRPLV